MIFTLYQECNNLHTTQNPDEICGYGAAMRSVKMSESKYKGLDIKEAPTQELIPRPSWLK